MNVCKYTQDKNDDRVEALQVRVYFFCNCTLTIICFLFSVHFPLPCAIHVLCALFSLSFSVYFHLIQMCKYIVHNESIVAY